MAKIIYDEIIKGDVINEIQSSPEEINSFMNSIIYKDFINEINIRIAQSTILLDDPDLELTGRHYDLLRGRKKNLVEMLNLFPDMRANKLSDDLELEEGESKNVE